MLRTMLFILLLSVSGDAWAKTDLSLPRFVSIRASEANVRTGPGLRYQIKWVMVRKNMPVEVIAEFEQWRKIRDIQGDEGWVHRSMLSGKRYAIVQGEEQILRRHPEPNEVPVARAEMGVLGQVSECRPEYCQIRIDGGYKGWIAKDHLWGVYSAEIFD